MDRTLKGWRARLEKDRSAHREEEALWRAEYTSLCVLADYPTDTASRDYYELRQLIFDIPDAGSRKALITHWRKHDQLERRGALLEEGWRSYAVEEAKGQADNWWISPASLVVVLCIGSLGLQRIGVSPVVGAIAAAAFSVLLGLGYRDVCLRSMRESVRDARHELAGAKNALAELRSEGTFSRAEEETGKMDGKP
jgi:hypothetical protein